MATDERPPVEAYGMLVPRAIWDKAAMFAEARGSSHEDAVRTLMTLADSLAPPPPRLTLAEFIEGNRQIVTGSGVPTSKAVELFRFKGTGRR